MYNMEQCNAVQCCMVFVERKERPDDCDDGRHCSDDSSE